jgi:hypothetical protein
MSSVPMIAACPCRGRPSCRSGCHAEPIFVYVSDVPNGSSESSGRTLLYIGNLTASSLLVSVVCVLSHLSASVGEHY